MEGRRLAISSTLEGLRAELDSHHYVGAVALVGLAGLPFLIGDLQLLTVTAALYFAAFVMAWDAVSGYTGQMSFGHSAFLATGAYTSALLNVHYGLSLPVTIFAGALAAGLFGLLVGIPVLRLQGPYLSLVTLILPLIMLQVFIHFSDITGGQSGLLQVATLASGIQENYYIAFGVFLFIGIILTIIMTSNAGKILTAIREDEEAVSVCGLNPAKFKIFAFALSAFLSGLAGSIFAHSIVGGASPSLLLVLTVNVEIIIAAILGGMGSVGGAAFGGMIFYLFRDWLSSISWSVPIVGLPFEELYIMIFYVLVVAVLLTIPEGIYVSLVKGTRRTSPLESIFENWRKFLASMRK